jgi:hypothetical protein
MAHHLRQRDAEEGAGLRARDAGEKVFPSHAGIDDHGHRAELEEGESGGDQRQALAHHDQHAVAWADAARGEFRGPRIHFLIEFVEREREIVDPSVGGPSPRHFDRRPVRLTRRHQ